MIKLKGICAGYGTENVLSCIDISLENGRFTAIIGPNGCGKSTLLKTVAGIIDPSEGELLLDGGKMPKYTERAKRVSYLPQGGSAPEMTVLELVLHGRYPWLGFPKRFTKADREVARNAILKMGISDSVNDYMSTLSGGMKQRAFIAMTLAAETDHLLLDEPTTYLDVAGKLELMRILRSLSSDDRSVTAVLHEIDLAMRYADRICVMDKGKAAFFGTPDEVYSSGILEDVFGVKTGRIEGENGYYYYYSEGDGKAGDT